MAATKINRVLLLAPFNANGGIATWANSLLQQFDIDNFELVPLCQNPFVSNSGSRLRQIIAKVLNLLIVEYRLRKILSKGNISIVHTTTSGSLSYIRDIRVAKICNQYKIPSILHCHFGCIKDQLEEKNKIGEMARKAFSLYKQVWVLDTKSSNYIKNNIKNCKCYLSPNPIKVPQDCFSFPTSFKNFCFIGNLNRTKGIIEIIKAFSLITESDIILHVIGPDPEGLMEQIKKIAGDKLGKNIIMYGLLPNKETMLKLLVFDALILPTYMSHEAFPISILEAMSRGKLIISCDRAAIKDMLTGQNNEKCGLLIQPQSPNEIMKSVLYAYYHQDEMVEICHSAYIKVKNAYDTPIVHQLYAKYYNECLIDNN